MGHLMPVSRVELVMCAKYAFSFNIDFNGSMETSGWSDCNSAPPAKSFFFQLRAGCKG